MQRLAVLCGLAFVLAVTAYGQGGGNAAMTGTVTDQTGAVIVGATVTMTQIGTDLKRSATTNENGQFSIPSLPPANYRISVEASGFKTYVREVTLLADQSGNLQIPMQLGTASET